MKITSLNLPKFDAKIVERQGKILIFDIIRQKYVALTNEEWVRQNFTHHLINNLQYPRNKISIETSISYNNLSKRCDCIVYNNDFEPIMILEYKAPNIEITQKVFDQIFVYNKQLNVPYLLVSNGFNHLFCSVANLTIVSNIPNYSRLIGGEQVK